MAVVIASNLRKELSGDPLFDGVSFKVERRDRVALSGPNGAGKTTLLRALVGETTLQGGELAFQKGTRVALHDQRPPAESAATLRDYVLSGAADLTAAERELRRLEEAMAQGDHEPATLRAYAETQAAELMLKKAGVMFEAGLPCGEEANIARLLAAEAAWHAGEACMQTHGGFGYAREYDVERKWREARLSLIAPISTNLILSYIGEHVLQMPRSY